MSSIISGVIDCTSRSIDRLIPRSLIELSGSTIIFGRVHDFACNAHKINENTYGMSLKNYIKLFDLYFNFNWLV